MSSFTKHREFVKEISAPLKKPEPKPVSKKNYNIFEDMFEEDDDYDIQAELETKFDELFGTFDDDDDYDDDDE